MKSEKLWCHEQVVTLIYGVAMSAPSVLRDKSYLFAIRIVKCVQFLRSEKKEYILSSQIMRSGTAIGALVREAQFAQSRADFSHKMNIALKESNETEYWISLLKDTDYISNEMFESLDSDCRELIAMLVATVKKTKE